MLSADLICYKRTAATQYITPLRFVEMTKGKDHKPEEEKESEQKIRDLPPKKDVKAGNSKEKGCSSGRTGEVDFMRDYD